MFVCIRTKATPHDITMCCAAVLIIKMVVSCFKWFQMV
jgi:hypothetical protein